MFDLTVFLVVALAVYRVWRFAAEDGLTAPLRARLPDRVLSFVACPWCFGFWLSVAGYLVWREWGANIYVQASYFVLAVSALVGLAAGRDE